MPVDRARLTALADDVDRFYVRDRAMRRAQEAMQILLRNDAPLGDAAVRGYLRAVNAYFAPFEREARAHLSDLDKRLGRVSQLQFNLTAERGVASRRIEATRAVLALLNDLT